MTATIEASNRIVIASVLIALLVGPSMAAGYDSLPIGPISPADSLPGVPNHDVQALTFGDAPTNSVLVVGLEDYRLWSRRSTDAGATFGVEASIDGVEVHQVQGRRAADGKLYLAYVVTDPAGGLGVRVIRSDDLGLTWSQPQEVIHDGAPGHPASSVMLATGPSGNVAVIASGDGSLHPYVSVSSNGGVTWTTPVRVDPGGSTAVSLGEIDVAVDTASRIHVVYIQDRGTGSGPRTYRTRSIDGGLTFAAETELVFAFDTKANSLDIDTATDGNMLLAVCNAGDFGAQLYMLRSSNGGSSYVTQWNRAFDDFVYPGSSCQPQLVIDPGTSTTFLHARGLDLFARSLLLWRSADAGVTWPATPVVLTNTLAVGKYLASIGVTHMRRVLPTGWMIAWTDSRADTYVGRFRSLYARVSFDDGATFGPEMRIDDVVATPGNRTLMGIAPALPSHVPVVWTDGGIENTRSDDVHVDRFSLSTPSFGTDTHLDVDGGLVAPESSPLAAVATDGASHVYHAFAANTTGPYADMWVAVSSDLGRTLGTPVRVGDTVAGAEISSMPRLRAFADGRVYLLYFLDIAGNRQIRFNRSLDFGASWLPSDVLIGTYFAYVEFLDVAGLAALADGTVHAVWSDQSYVYWSKSTDAGASFTTPTAIEQDSLGFVAIPEICANGDRIIVTFMAWSGQAFTWYAVISENRGATWLPRFTLRNPQLPGVDYYPTPASSLACGPGGTASFVWRDSRSGAPQLFSNRFNGASWTGDAAVAAPPGSKPSSPSAAFSSSGTVIVAYESGSGEIHVSRSADGGATYPSFARLDGTAPDPLAASHTVRTVGDGSGNVWVRFMDRSGGLDSIVSRASRDDGLTWGGLRRLSGEQPVASRRHAVGPTDYFGGDAAAAAGNAYFVWGGQRASQLLDPLLNTWDADDLDRDGQPSGTDCDDTDPSLQSPAAVAAVVAAKVAGATRVSWQSQSAAGITYDVVTGSLSAVHSSGGFGAAECLSNDQTASQYDDGFIPPAGDARYYLIRAGNECGAGTFGDSSLVPDPREVLDSTACM